MLPLIGKIFPIIVFTLLGKIVFSQNYVFQLAVNKFLLLGEIVFTGKLICFLVCVSTAGKKGFTGKNMCFY